MSNDYQTALEITRQCERAGANLCPNFEEWTRAAFALASLGEQGRELFHRIASADPSYSRRDSDRKFDNALRSGRNVTIGSLVYLARSRGINVSCQRSSLRDEKPVATERRSVREPSLIPEALIARSEGTANNLCRFLLSRFDGGDVRRAAALYRIGSTRAGETIFPQIDDNGLCRTAKVIMYNPYDGHRDRSRGADWLHSRLMRMQGKAAADYELRQSLFGEHLLAKRPNDTVALVEAEKTALIATILFPSALWLATGGSGGFTAERLSPLMNRKVIVFADADMLDQWKKKAEAIKFARGWKFSSWADREPDGSHRDIADALIEQVAH